MPGHVVRKYRELRNFSQKYIAAKMGISQNAYSKIENNLTQLTVYHVKELSKILDVPVTDLLKDDFEIHRPPEVYNQVSKSQLLVHIDQLKTKLENKQSQKHHHYIVAMSLIAAAEQAILPVH